MKYDVQIEGYFLKHPKQITSELYTKYQIKPALK